MMYGCAYRVFLVAVDEELIDEDRRALRKVRPDEIQASARRPAKPLRRD